MKIDKRSKENLSGVHADLRRLLEATDVPYPIVVTEGLRTLDDQRHYIDIGSSDTLNSRHLTGHAFDFAVFPNGIDGKPSWDFRLYQQTWTALQRQARALHIAVTWGGNWNSRDGTHVQLSWDDYPLGSRPVQKATTSTTIAAAGGISMVAFANELIKMIEGVESGMTSYAALAMIVVGAAYIIKERLGKMEKDGV